MIVVGSVQGVGDDLTVSGASSAGPIVVLAAPPSQSAAAPANASYVVLAPGGGSQGADLSTSALSAAQRHAPIDAQGLLVDLVLQDWGSGQPGS
jgi:predicted glycosyltransferase